MEANIARKSIQRALANLSQVELDQFRTELVNRPVEPRVLRNRVEKKKDHQVAEVMVAAFTARNALDVAMELLGEMGLIQNAQDLAAEAMRRGLPPLGGPGNPGAVPQRPVAVVPPVPMDSDDDEGEVNLR